MIFRLINEFVVNILLLLATEGATTEKKYNDK